VHSQSTAREQLLYSSLAADLNLYREKERGGGRQREWGGGQQRERKWGTWRERKGRGWNKKE